MTVFGFITTSSSIIVFSKMQTLGPITTFFPIDTLLAPIQHDLCIFDDFEIKFFCLAP